MALSRMFELCTLIGERNMTYSETMFAVTSAIGERKMVSHLNADEVEKVIEHIKGGEPSWKCC